MKTNQQRTFRKGFSLLELMVVVTIISVMLVLAVPAINSINIGMAISRGGDDLSHLLNRARMKAITESKAVEVRFYDLPREHSDDDKVVKVIQMTTQRDDGTYQSSNPVWLPDGIGISRNRKMSTLNSKFLLEGKAEHAFPLEPDAPYIGFRFRPDGSAELPTNEKWFFTIVHQSAAESSKIPDNFFTVQLDPVIGQIRILRP